MQIRVATDARQPQIYGFVRELNALTMSIEALGSSVRFGSSRGRRDNDD
jgi:hypothetical protein